MESSKLIWSNLGGTTKEFDFILKKESFIFLKKFPINGLFVEPVSLVEAIRILIYSEFIKIFPFISKELVFSEDVVVLKSEDNLTLLEKELYFVKRNFPKFPSSSFMIDNQSKDAIIRIALDQRKKQSLKLENILKKKRNIL